MGMLKRFLDTSTIHGLSHISSARSKTAKLVWALVVLIAFSTAGYLITSSIKEWKESPISTTISTHPIAELEYPKVTVCPPQDTNTVLNLGVVAANNSFDNSTKEILKTAVVDIFIESDHQKHVKFIDSFIDINSARNIYMGLETFPVQQGKSGFEMKIANNEGQITTPYFDQQYNAEFDKENHYYHYVFEFSDNIDEIMGLSGELVLGMNIGARETKDFTEVVEYKTGHRYKLIEFEDNWTNAQLYCKKMDGHLVTITSDGELNEVFSMASSDIYDRLYWIGAVYFPANNTLSWVTGEPWTQLSLFNHVTCDNDVCCIALDVTYNELFKQPCESMNYYICEIEKGMETFSGQQVKSFTYSLEDIFSMSAIHVWWKHKIINDDILLHNDRPQTTGLKVQWYIRNKLKRKTWKIKSPKGQIHIPDQSKIINYNRSYSYDVVLETTENLTAAVADGSLVIHMEANLSEVSGWMEKIVLKAGEKYKYFDERKTWDEAKVACISENSQLATITSKTINDEIMALVTKSPAWIGGYAEKGDWKWVDEKKWDYTNWDKRNPIDNQKKVKVAIYDEGKWRNYSPRAKLPFICETLPYTMKGTINKTWIYQKEKLTFDSIDITWTYDYPGHDIFTLWNQTSDIGFSLSWHIVDSSGHIINQAIDNISVDIVPNTKLPNARYLEQNKYFVTLVNVVQVAMAKGMDVDKMKNFATAHKHSRNHASLDSFIKDFGSTLIDFETDNAMHENISDDALFVSLEIYSYLTYSPSNYYESFGLVKFLNNLINNHNPSTVLQAISNTINMNKLQYVYSKVKLLEFNHMLCVMMGIDIDSVLLAKLSTKQINSMVENQMLYMEGNTPEDTDFLSTKELNNISTTETMELASHPVHLVDKNKKMMPSAFIPYCAYKGDMEVMGEYVDGFQFPFCNKFTKTILNGELCYTATLPRHLKTESGKTGKLIIILDYNYERYIGPVDEDGLKLEKRASNKINYLEINEVIKSLPEAKLYIHTMSGYVGFGSGSFKMSALKVIKGTDNYFQLSQNVKKCTMEVYEECLTREILRKAFDVCQCYLWEFQKHIYIKNSTICNPKGRECFNNIRKEAFNCSTPCQGLYADVHYKEWSNNNNNPDQTSTLKALTVEYINYKNKIAENFAYYRKNYEEYIKKVPYSPLEVITVSFDTDTFDLVEKDVKMTFEAALGVIGGTMGLLTGFSLLSGVEIIYFLIKYFLAFAKKKISN